MAVLVPANLLLAFAKPRVSCAIADNVTLTVVEAGTLVLTSGKVLAGDPLYVAGSDYPPFDRLLTPGAYPIDLAIAGFNNDERVACARIRISNLAAVRFEACSKYGHGVDNGAWCFVDVEAARCLQTFSEPEFNAFWDRMRKAMDGTYQPTRSWASLPIREDLAANMVVCDSGFGDGGYLSYYGFDGSGQFVSVVSDFGVLLTQEEISKLSRKWWKFW